MARASLADVEKRCDCDASKWAKCADPWYGKKFTYKGKEHAPNVSRYALEILNREIATKAEAIDVWEAMRTAIRLGTYVSAKAYRPAPAAAAKTTTRAADAPATLTAIVAAYDAAVLEPSTKAANSKTNDRAALARLTAELGDRDMDGIDVDDLVDWRAELETADGEPLAQSTWNKYRTVLGQLWRWAAWKKYISADLFHVTPKELLAGLGRKKPAQRNRRIDDREWANLLEAAREVRTTAAAKRLGAVLLALWETGARIGELLALQWGDVHLDRGLLHLRALEVGAKKTGRSRWIEISAPLRVVLLAIRHDPAGAELGRSKYVFGDEYGGRVKSIDKAWRTAVLLAHNVAPKWTEAGDFDKASRAALRGFNLHVHDIRHEHGSRLLESGHWTLAQIQERLGHTSIAQTATYLHAQAGANKTSQAAYDAARQAAAEAESGTKAAASGDKLGTNDGSLRMAKARPRLVKGAKSKK